MVIENPVSVPGTAAPETRTPAAAAPQQADTVPVERISGSGRIETAVEASRFAFPTGAPAVVVAAAHSFPDALAAAPLATQLGGPLLLVGGRTPAVVSQEITRLGALEAVIVGGSSAVPVVVQAELRQIGLPLTVRRIAGEDRADTAALIAREVGSSTDDEAVVAYSGGFADAVSVAPLAGAHGLPLVLTGRDALHPDAAAALRDLGTRRTLVVGGEDALSAAVAARVPSPTRVSGPDRYATSVAVAELARQRGASLSTVYVATGRDFPDALAAGPVAAADDAVVLLVHGQDPAAAGVVYEWLAQHLGEIDRIVVFGGPAAVSPEVEQRLARPGGGA